MLTTGIVHTGWNMTFENLKKMFHSKPFVFDKEYIKIAGCSSYGFYSKFLEKFFVLVILEGCAKNTPKIKKLLELQVLKNFYSI